MRLMKASRTFCTALTILLGMLIVHSMAGASTPTDKELLGRLLFSDTSLSSPNGQACLSCHVPEAGFADPDRQFPTSEGILPNRFGPRNAPTVTYLATAPDFSTNLETGASAGGQFLDGRAFDLVDLAGQPFLNPIEMHSPNSEHVIQAVRKASYAPLFRQVFGMEALNDYDSAYSNVAIAIAEFLKSPELNKFNSKFDYFLEGELQLTDQELQGLELFSGKAGCARCHVTTPNAQGGHPVFTSFGYANVGVPRNPDNLFYTGIPALNPDRLDFVDLGLGAHLRNIGLPESAYGKQFGKFNFPTLRNIAKTAPYFHNGVFPDLKSAVHFVNVRDLLGPDFHSEFEGNVSTAVGNQGLTEEEEDAIVAFLETLTDDYVP